MLAVDGPAASPPTSTRSRYYEGSSAEACRLFEADQKALRTRAIDVQVVCYRVATNL